MDRVRFDALARALAAAGSRRGVMGAILSGALVGTGFEAAAKKKHKNKNKHKNKQKHNQPETCFGTLECAFPSDGQSFRDCDLANTILGNCNGCDFRGADLGGANLAFTSYQGASFRESNLRGADLEDADVSGASFRDACLIDANFLGANTDGAHFGGAVFCGTIEPNGQINNSGCGQTTECCNTGAPAECAKDSDCGGSEPFCCDSVCSEFCCFDSQCPGQESCDAGVCQIPNPTCAVDPDACSDGFVVCAGSGIGTCYCYVTTEGDSRCVNINQLTNPFCAGTPCDSSDDCGAGEFCAALHSTDGICCTAKICGRECPEFSARTSGNEPEVTPPQP